jgi:hypothetical protein
MILQIALGIVLGLILWNVLSFFVLLWAEVAATRPPKPAKVKKPPKHPDDDWLTPVLSCGLVILAMFWWVS